MNNLEDKIKELESIHALTEPSEIFAALVSAIDLLKRLKDETESAWAMLEEQKSSDIERHATLLKKEIDKKLSETLSLVKSKVVLA